MGGLRGWVAGGRRDRCVLRNWARRVEMFVFVVVVGGALQIPPEILLVSLRVRPGVGGRRVPFECCGLSSGAGVLVLSVVPQGSRRGPLEGRRSDMVRLISPSGSRQLRLMIGNRGADSMSMEHEELLLVKVSGLVAWVLEGCLAAPRQGRPVNGSMSLVVERESIVPRENSYRGG